MKPYLEKINNKLVSAHTGDMQNVALVEHTLRDIHLGLERLAQLGHLFHLAPGECLDPESCAWGPRIYWHWDGRCKEVWHPTDVDVLGPGWAPSLAEAKVVFGQSQQFAGRGGVRSHNLPQVMTDLAWVLPSPAEREVDRKGRIAQWKMERENGKI